MSLRAALGPTLDSMPTLMMVPVMVRISLMTRRMYQPLMNSMRSDQQTLRSRVSLKYCTNSWKQKNVLVNSLVTYVTVTVKQHTLYLLEDDAS